jgi:hypothetical protein
MTLYVVGAPMIWLAGIPGPDFYPGKNQTAETIEQIEGNNNA